MSTKHSKSDPKFVLAIDQGMLRSAFRSLFWAVISERKKDGTFKIQSLVENLPKGDKGKVSKWFNGDPNWTLNTIAAIASALNLDLRIEAVDRNTRQVFRPSGPQEAPYTNPVKTETDTAARSIKVLRVPPAGLNDRVVAETIRASEVRMRTEGVVPDNSILAASTQKDELKKSRPMGGLQNTLGGQHANYRH